MLVTRIIGNCPKCKKKDCFGNVSVGRDYVLRGCLYCQYSKTIPLPEIRKKVIYLDQFFFSGAFRGKEQRFVKAAERIHSLSDQLLLVAPYSSVHKNESHLWRGFDDKNHDELMNFIKDTSRGHEFRASYEVQQTQILKAFDAFLKQAHSKIYVLNTSDAINGFIHEWDDYFRIDFGNYYVGDIEITRSLKNEAIEGLLDSFDVWRKSTTSFQEDVEFEIHEAGQEYLKAYFTYKKRLATGDYAAIYNAPIVSMIVERMTYKFSENNKEDMFIKIANFFSSSYFSNLPYLTISTKIYAKLQDMVKNGAYTNRSTAQKKLSGFFYDVEHIATYAPYCDAFIMDKPMAELVSDTRVGLEKNFNVRVFSLNNWTALMQWLDQLESEMTDEHKKALDLAYPQEYKSIFS